MALFLTTGGAFAADGEDDQNARKDKTDTEEVTVTGTPLEQTTFDLNQNVSVVSGRQLEEDMSGNIGQMLDNLPGLATSYFGPGVGRPIIRGLDGDRVRILVDGIGTLDVSTNNPDHAVAIDPLNATSIEVIRGPATLLYGNNAIGGVVNVRDGRIPDALPDEGVDMRGRLFYGTNAKDLGFSTALDIAAGQDWVFHMQGAVRDAKEMKVPGFLRSEEFMMEHPLMGDEVEPFKDAENTGLSSGDYAFGVTRLFDDGFAGVSVSRLKSNYGLPEVPGFGEEKEIRVRMEQTRFDFDSEINRDFMIFKKAKLRFGYADYDHTEIEDEDIGTRFMTEGFEGRLELVQQESGNLSGAMGMQFLKKDFNSFGDESSTPMTTTTQIGFFVYEEYADGPWTWQGGVRIDFQDINAPSIATKRSFTAASFSGGVRYAFSDDLVFAIMGHRTQRAPNEEELFSDGPEVAAQIFKEGDPTLGLETGTGFELSLKKRSGPLTASASFYYTSYNNYIIEGAKGEGDDEEEEEEELKPYEFRAADARFYGGEFEVKFEAFSNDRITLNLDADVDIVHATEVASGMPLPRIPPMSAHFGGEILSEFVDFRIELEVTKAQNRVAAHEDPTEGYTDVNAFLTLRPFGAEENLAVQVAARNLTNAEIHHHTSFLKEILPDQGRNVQIMLTGAF